MRLLLPLAVLLLAGTSLAAAHGGDHGSASVSGTVGKVLTIQSPPPMNAGQVIVPIFNRAYLTYLGRTPGAKQWTFRFRARKAGSTTLSLVLREKKGGKQVGKIAVPVRITQG